jgi:hypothetical protein
VCPIKIINEVRLLGFMRAVRSERLKLKYNMITHIFFLPPGEGGGG